MDGHQLSNVIIAAIVVGGVLVATVTQAIIRLRATRHAGGASITPQIDQRLERMEQAIESIAVEVERISEAQRFTAKLLSDRVGAEPRQPERVITPR